MNNIPTYEVWQERLTDYISRFESQRKGFLRLQNMLAGRGFAITEFGIRQHYAGRHKDVGITLARLTIDCIDADEKGCGLAEDMVLEGF